MKILLSIVKWVLIILFFPLSLLFVAYFKQRKSKKEYFKDEY
ncbi:MAG: hypothetical protein ABIQ40_19180 [Bacteroidia bacterium]